MVTRFDKSDLVKNILRDASELSHIGSALHSDIEIKDDRIEKHGIH